MTGLRCKYPRSRFRSASVHMVVIVFEYKIAIATYKTALARCAALRNL